MLTEPFTLPGAAIRIPAGGRIWLQADITTPPGAKGTVLIVHGSGSSRQSPVDQMFASALNGAHFVTVLADLLTPVEEKLDAQTAALRFDIPLLTGRVIRMIDWLGEYDLISTLPLGLFGAGTDAAAALDAAAARPEAVRAIVSRGGRPDLAANLEAVTSPALLIVGNDDPLVLDINRKALEHLNGVKQLEIAPHERVGALAEGWFAKYLR